MAYTATKAQIANAGETGHIFASQYKDLSMEDIMKFFGAMILDVLNPSPRVTMKMRPQFVDKVQGNNFIAKHIGENYKLKYKLC
eukprot:3742453-Ditylum_brightwellii.AAC.1